MKVSPGSVVNCRQRRWIVLPSANSEVVQLRPLSGDESQMCGIYLPLEPNAIQGAEFPAPTIEEYGDYEVSRLLFNAARLSLRSGAGPFRCLGRLSVRPRPYQLVPLLMALRQETLRLLIADDVGVGKTIEAGLILREMIDRGEVRRSAILCPPHLCDQWQKELKEKFHLDAVVIRSGTVGKLERQLPPGDSHIFSYFPHIIVSLDYAKGERRRASFVTHCPDLVIVDEAHTCANTGRAQIKEQQRYQLLQDIANKRDRHLVLLTATPHSGLEASFLSLLGLLKAEFEKYSLEHLSEAQRIELAKHFVQRRRADIKQWMGSDTPFPNRDSQEVTYRLSGEYNRFFEDVYEFARGLITEVSGLSFAQKRGRYWSALAIIRCVMSSPEAAVATLSNQLNKDNDKKDSQGKNSAASSSEEFELDEEISIASVYDSAEQEKFIDSSPTSLIEQAKQSYDHRQKRELARFITLAQELRGQKDEKLQTVQKLVKKLLKEGKNPIVWCRYIATANYVARALQQQFETKKDSSIRVIAITGEQSEDEREIRLEELKGYPQRVMVATDCLSEGVNLQESFTAAIHYDLPWNPNRLEQREGRIDRFGQTAPTVDCFLLYGNDNPMDGAVLEVLLRKAVKIHRSLGVTVPVPMDSASVQGAIFQSLFERVQTTRQLPIQQLTIFDQLTEDNEELLEINANWDKAVEREKVNRTRFAQRTIKPEEVKTELEESDRVLGNERDIEEFVKAACARYGAPLKATRRGWLLSGAPPFLEKTLGDKSRSLSFTSPAPEGAEYVGRNHPLTEGLARHLLEAALNEKKVGLGGRCGLAVTSAVAAPTALLLLRVRYLLQGRKASDLLAEECLLRAFTGAPMNPQWLPPEAAEALSQNLPIVGDWPMERARGQVRAALSLLPQLTPHLTTIALEQAERLEQSHRRVRRVTQEGQVTVKPQLPVDILGFYLLQPPSANSPFSTP